MYLTKKIHLIVLVGAKISQKWPFLRRFPFVALNENRLLKCTYLRDYH